VRLFRISRQRQAVAAFDGVGASLYPGRWNERARRVVYATSRIPLGILEILVQSSGAPLTGYVAYPLDVPDDVLETFDRSLLSRSWRTADRGRTECRVHGDRWLARGASAGLIVPSAVVPEAYGFGDVNVVLNPLHALFARVTIADPLPLDLDPRLHVLASPLPGATSPQPSRRKTPRRPRR
jgi:RES domain-containing protein